MRIAISSIDLSLSLPKSLEVTGLLVLEHFHMDNHERHRQMEQSGSLSEHLLSHVDACECADVNAITLLMCIADAEVSKKRCQSSQSRLNVGQMTAGCSAFVRTVSHREDCERCQTHENFILRENIITT